MDARETLCKIQRELKAPKSQFNKFGNYHYRNVEDILEAVKPLLGDAFLVLTDEIVLIGERYYVKATATISTGLTQGDFIFNTAYAREPHDRKGMDESQITGSASSYARKYALQGMFLIDDNRDADSMDHSDRNVGDAKPVRTPVKPSTPVTPPVKKTISKEQVQDLKNILAIIGKERSDAFWEWMGKIGKTQIDEMTLDEHAKALKSLTSKAKE